MARLLHSFFLQWPVGKPAYPLWDLPLVLKALVGAPFEPLSTVEAKFLSFKVLFLIAVTSAKRI